MLKYTKEHEWIKADGNNATIGITSYAQESLGDIVFVQMPEPGSTVEPGDSIVVPLADAGYDDAQIEEIFSMLPAAPLFMLTSLPTRTSSRSSIS